VQPLRGTAEVELLGQGHEIAQLSRAQMNIWKVRIHAGNYSIWE
jgi:hypothetical protein